jgi:hypothetical protein
MSPTLLALLLTAGPIYSLDRESAVAGLCADLAPLGSRNFGGDALERGKREAEARKKRAAAFEATYLVTLPGAAVAFSPWDSGRLALSRHSSLEVGGLRVVLTESEELPVDADEAAARRILDAQKKGTLRLRLALELPDDDGGSPCAARGMRFTLGAEPVSWAYEAEGQVLATGGEAAGRASVQVGAKPRVVIGPAPATGDPGAGADLGPHAGGLARCYDEALKRDPTLDGTLVFAVELDKAGKARALKVLLDSVQDEALAACARGIAERAEWKLAAQAKLARVEVPVRFVLEPPAK